MHLASCLSRSLPTDSTDEAEYKEFVLSGGYQTKEYWKHEFVKNERVLGWEEAMAEFRDGTGRPGPANWELGDYPQGLDDYPVAGVS